ncbi:MAG: hypothetical protein V3S49_04945 [Thermodesulfobacteriota bacterium]
MPTVMTPEELTNHAMDCFKVAQLAQFNNHIKPSMKMDISAKKWCSAGRRALYRADQILCGNGDPAFVE